MELLTKDFTASIGFDYKLYREEIEYSIAHTSLLVEHGYLTEEERVTIVNALREIEKEIGDGTLSFSNECFDIHGNIRAFLISKIGNLGKKLGIARGITRPGCYGFASFSQEGNRDNERDPYGSS